ncbi:MAG: hypothetical protein KIT86_15170 [Hydrogenophaga sp.]|jgi:hypothetical protein|uniref:hypothetical protein n=1 Tax=Hydrogenophaga sp. TaxID=1904254 RepID=UPI00261BFD3D|nr:hypothetical protein [Hydrogenophaga sp.]MCW5670997.1 hypothetical protein [Hydrogenophaga sp.]
MSGGWLEPLIALGAIFLPLLMAWGLVARGARRPRPRRRHSGDNATQPRKPS